MYPMWTKTYLDWRRTCCLWNQRGPKWSPPVSLIRFTKVSKVPSHLARLIRFLVTHCISNRQSILLPTMKRSRNERDLKDKVPSALPSSTGSEGSQTYFPRTTWTPASIFWSKRNQRTFWPQSSTSRISYLICPKRRETAKLERRAAPTSNIYLLSSKSRSCGTGRRWRDLPESSVCATVRFTSGTGIWPKKCENLRIKSHQNDQGILLNSDLGIS